MVVVSRGVFEQWWRCECLGCKLYCDSSTMSYDDFVESAEQSPTARRLYSQNAHLIGARMWC